MTKMSLISTLFVSITNDKKASRGSDYDLDSCYFMEAVLFNCVAPIFAFFFLFF